MRVGVVILSILALVASRPAIAQERPSSPCRFAVSGAIGSPKVSGPEEVTSRFMAVNQPDSPIEIVAADFTGTDLRVSGGSYTVQDRWSVTARNRSDQPIMAFQVGVSVFNGAISDNGTWKNMGGTGTATTWKGVLMPSASAIATGQKSGLGQGSHPDSNDVRVLLSVERVDFSDCSYQPSKAIPK